MSWFQMTYHVVAQATWLLLCGTLSVHADLLWFDGSRDETDNPPGRLLSDNEGYWGECVLTGVEYRYEVQPDSPADAWRDDASRFGRRLLDGHPRGSWWVPVGVSGRPLTVVFDFKRTCTFTEVDLSTRNKKVGIKIECADTEDGDWTTVYDRSRADCPDHSFHRLPLPEGSRGRYLRLLVAAESTTWVSEVWVWGDAEVSDKTPEAINPIVATPKYNGISYESIPGIARSTASDEQFWEWRRSLGVAAKLPVVWSRVPTWDSIANHPILPNPSDIGKPVELVMARNETEAAAVALTSTSMGEPSSVEVSLTPFRRATDGPVEPRVTGQLLVAGAIPSRWYGVTIGPLFSRDNMLGKSLMQRYLTNGASIMDFPRLTLAPGSSAILWISVNTDDATPGEYEARLSVSGGSPLTVRVRVVDVTLPRPFVWLQTWSGITSMLPFVYEDRQKREVAYKQSLGVTVWHGFPTEDSPAALARKRGRTIHQIWGIGEYGHRLYGGKIDPDKLTADDERAVAEMIRKHVQQAQELGLSYDDWYVELTDEPGKRNAAAFGALCRLIRKADPRVHIYCNPSFWIGWEKGAVESDRDIYQALGPWYTEMVDVSVPVFLLLEDRPMSYRLFDAPRFVRAYYHVASHHAKGESAALVEHYRRMAWGAFERGWNGWGFYSYYAPRGNPWNDFDAQFYTQEDLPDYQVVYPGPRGPVATRQSEAIREGWEDYCLLTLLRQRGLNKQLDSILRAYKAGVPLQSLRLRALRAAAHLQ